LAAHSSSRFLFLRIDSGTGMIAGGYFPTIPNFRRMAETSSRRLLGLVQQVRGLLMNRDRGAYALELPDGYLTDCEGLVDCDSEFPPNPEIAFPVGCCQAHHRLRGFPDVGKHIDAFLGDYFPSRSERTGFWLGGRSCCAKRIVAATTSGEISREICCQKSMDK
jgi:hypothetical protein